MIVSMLQLGTVLIASGVRPIWGRFDHERPKFETSDMWMLVSIAALLIAAAVVAHRSSRRRRQEFTHDSPRLLFWELCRAHRLPFASRRLLKQLAAAQGISEPAMLFVDSSSFESAGLPAALQPRANEIRTLRNQLFG